MKIKNLIICMMSLFLLVFSISSLSAYYWTSYGGGYTPLWHESFYGGSGRFDLGTTTSSIVEGYRVGGDVAKIPFQPMVWSFNSTDNYFVISNNNYIQIYDGELLLVYEVFSDLSVSQIDIMDFSIGDDFMNDILGVFEFNDTSVSFKSFEYNVTSNTFNQTTEHQINVNANKEVNGLRCGGKRECYFTITELGSTTFYIANETDLTSVALPLLNGTPIEPVGFIDTDDDGETEFFIYSNTTLMLFERDGSVDVIINASSGKSFRDARMFQPDATNFWRFAVLERTEKTGNTHELHMIVYKSDGSIYWSDLLIDNNLPFYSGGNTHDVFGRIAIVDDYNGDFFDDIYMVAFKNQRRTDTNTDFSFRVYRGYDGTELSSFDFSTLQADGLTLRDDISLTLGDMNGDGVKDFIYLTGDDYLEIRNPVTTSKIFGSSFTYGFDLCSCVPADLDFDGFLDVLCTGISGTQFVNSNGTNQNAQISSVAYVPSTSIVVNSTLLAYVTATDNEGDTPLYYGVKCSDVESWIADSTSHITSCFYGSIGTFNHSVRVRDIYHFDYDIHSQPIFVTPTGVICDNDGICEAGQGENYLNCPNDCPVPDTTTSSVEGSLTLPTELVDTENIKMGLLPEIYYGTLGFMSSVLSPLIVLVFLFLFVMIIITIGVIIKKIAIRVMGR